MPEQLAALETVQDTAIEDELNHAAAYDAQTLHWFHARGEDRRAGGVQFDLDRVDDAFEIRAVEGIERGMPLEEVCNV